jgi:hypothetical protein
MAEVAEENFVLRVQPPALAAKLRGWLREQRGLDGRAELLFEGAGARQWTSRAQRHQWARGARERAARPCRSAVWGGPAS